MARRLADLKVPADLVSIDAFVHGAQPTSIDASIYGFIANMLFYDIDTALKRCVQAHPQLVRHCHSIHARIGGDQPEAPCQEPAGPKLTAPRR